MKMFFRKLHTMILFLPIYILLSSALGRWVTFNNTCVNDNLANGEVAAVNMTSTLCQQSCEGITYEYYNLASLRKSNVSQK